MAIESDFGSTVSLLIPLVNLEGNISKYPLACNLAREKAIRFLDQKCDTQQLRHIAILLGRLTEEQQGYKDAIVCLTTFIESWTIHGRPRDKNLGVLYFNRACYRSRIAESLPGEKDRKREAWDDVVMAALYDPKLKDDAFTDPDLTFTVKDKVAQDLTKALLERRGEVKN